MTPEREERFRTVLEKRQPDLTVVLENVHDPHNISAVIRTCDAVGVSEIYVLNSNKRGSDFLGHKSSASARKWLKVHRFTDVETCFKDLKSKGFELWATHLSSEAVSLYELKFDRKIALIFGNEHEGVSDELLKYIDGNFIIPMYGMIKSLNISVAAAVTLYEALRQKQLTNAYDLPKIDEAERVSTFDAWVHREQLRKQNGKSS